MSFVAPLVYGPTQGGAAICRMCPSPISRRRGGSGLCQLCAAKNRAPPSKSMPRVGKCSDCDNGITEKSKGRCRSCSASYTNRLPETIVKRVAGWKKRLSDPVKYEQLCKTAKRNSQKAMADPVKRAEAVERAKLIYERYLNTDENRAAVAATRKQAGRKISEFRLSWCPPEYRELHRENVYSHRMLAAQSREMIEKLAANDSALRYIDSALDYLLKFAPVQRLENGYRYGNAILSPSEVVVRATARGWQPDRLAA